MARHHPAIPSTNRDYTYTIDDCDVVDKEQLRRYRSRRSAWLMQIDGDPEHSVWKQISAMLWNDAVFRSVNETRRVVAEGKNGSAALNGKLARFIDQGFVATQTLSIRRLMDPPEKKPERQVISLRRVLDDIKKHRELITREMYVAHDGLPFDPEPAKKRHYDKVMAESAGRPWFGSLDTTGPEAFDSSELAHQTFDALSGVFAAQRQRGDLIKVEVFEKLDKILEDSGWEDIKDYGNKYIAHAADEYSRGTVSELKGFSLERLARCHKALCHVATAIYGPILWQGSYGLIPVPQFDQFDQLDQPWLPNGERDHLEAFWDAHVEAVENWAAEDVLELRRR